MTRWSDLVVDKGTGAGLPTGRVPLATLVEAYLEGNVDVPDIDALLDARREVTTFGLTIDHVKFLLTRMVPEWLIHSRAQDRRIVRDHYDRGDDFFAAFLGETMIYTSGIFTSYAESLEQGQKNKMDLVCRKLKLQRDHDLLDIGCGWGTLAAHAAKHFGARTTGVTVACTGAAFGNARIAREGLMGRARIECVDYRDMPLRTYDRIVSLEMVEHVGIKNLAKYFSIVRDRLKDDGLFLIQWCGIRRGGGLGVPPVGMRPEDMVWCLFMNKHIFSGADASLPLGSMLGAMEKAGFEVSTVENISQHYVRTIQLWHANWKRNRDEVVARYGDRWWRIWNVFLAWSWRIGAQGTSACFQVVANKNLDTFDRKVHLSPRPLPTEMAAE